MFVFTDDKNGIVKEDNNLYPKTPEEDLRKEGGENFSCVTQLSTQSVFTCTFSIFFSDGILALESLPKTQ